MPASRLIPTPLAGQRVLVMGLGQFGGGVGVARFLVSQGALVTVTDMAPAEKLTASLAQLAGLPITFHLGRHDPADFTSAQLLVVSPAVDKAASPFVQAARQADVPLTSEMNLFLARCPARTIGVTGSVGKSTTTTLIHLALQAALETGHRTLDTPHVFLGGNIGKSLLADLPAMQPADFVVLELSSFMLEDTPAIAWSPHIAVVTNLVPNHLDRHGSLEAYAGTKQNILRFQSPADLALLNADAAAVAAWAPLATARVRTFTTRNLPPLPLQIPGPHNQSNARAALAVLDALEEIENQKSKIENPLARPAALRALSAFPGLAHRLQLVHTHRLPAGPEVRFYNDSKATTPDASITALSAFPAGTAIVIVGGYDKHVDMTPFTDLLAQRALGVLGVGQTGQALIEAVRKARPTHAAPDHIQYVETLDRAVPRAQRWATDLAAPIENQKSKIENPLAILLSPASASWGQFTNYEQRGDRFTELSRQ